MRKIYENNYNVPAPQQDRAIAWNDQCPEHTASFELYESEDFVQSEGPYVYTQQLLNMKNRTGDRIEMIPFIGQCPSQKSYKSHKRCKNNDIKL